MICACASRKVTRNSARMPRKMFWSLASRSFWARAGTKGRNMATRIARDRRKMTRTDRSKQGIEGHRELRRSVVPRDEWRQEERCSAMLAAGHAATRRAYLEASACFDLCGLGSRESGMTGAFLG